MEFGSQATAVMRSLFHDMNADRKAVLRGVDDGTKVTVEITVPGPLARSRKSEGVQTTTAADAQAAGSVQALHLRTTVGTSKAVQSTLTISEKGVSFDKTPSVRKDAVFLHTRTEVSAGELAGRFGQVVVAKQQDRVVDALRIIEPRIASIASVAEGNQSTLFADIGLNELVPLWLLGGGLNHLAHIVVAILEKRGRIILIDEVENGVYYEILPDMWRVIQHAAREADCQVFATTHSRECIAAAHRIFSETFDYDLSVQRLEAANGRVEAVAYKKETLEASIEAGFEVR